MARPSGIPGPQAYQASTLSLSYISAINKLLQTLTVLRPSTWSPGWWPSVLLPVEGLENARLPLFWFILLMCTRAEKNKPGPLFVSTWVSSWFLLGDPVSAGCWVARWSWRYLSLRYLRQTATVWMEACHLQIPRTTVSRPWQPGGS